MIKEVYSILQQMMVSANDDGAIGEISASNNTTLMKEWFDTYFLPYIKVSRVCYNEEGCWHGKGKMPNGGNMDSGQNSRGCGQATVSFILNNGAIVCMDDFGYSDLWNKYGVISSNPSSQTNLVFYIDLNGVSRPNITGKDIFIAVFDSGTGTFVPAGKDKTETEVEQNCSKTGTGFYCLSRIRRNGWKFPAYK